MAETSEIPPSKTKTVLLSLVIVVIIFGAIGVSFYFYTEYQKAQVLLKNPSAALAQLDKSTVEKVGQLIELPQEVPSIAEVGDTKKRQNQPFFAHAQDGDKVLIFPNAKKAILYRPSTNKIIEVGPVTVATNQPGQVSGESISPSPGALPALKIALYNGTTSVGLTNVAEKELKEKQPAVTVVLKDNAAKKTYEKTVVVDLTGNHAGAAGVLAALVQGEVSPLPAGEVKPDPKDSEGKTSDILIILGKDFVK